MAVPPFKVKAVYDYSSPHEDDLNFPVGQVITVTAKEDDDWYIGEYSDASGNPHSGLFPKNFVEDYQPPVPSRPTRAARPAVAEVRSSPPPPPTAQPSVPAPEAEQDPPVPDVADEEDETSVPNEPIPPPASNPFSPPPQQARTTVAQEQPRAPSPPPALQASDRQSATVAAASTPPKPAPPSANTPAASAKKVPPPVSEKPSSFKDRIAAFNKPAAAPVTPFKPSAGQPSFIKKPFVAPPPSSNAYVPPPRIEPVQKIYRRDEDPEIKEKEEQDRADAERAGLIPQDRDAAPAAEGEEGEDAPKPQSLKERIAMLQKQQMEQAARRADATQKEKPKKPLKKAPTDESVADAAAPPPVPVRLDDDEGNDEAEPTQRASIEGPLRRMPASSSIPPVPSSRRGTGPDEIHSEADNADMSAADEMTAEETETDDPRSTRQSLDQSRSIRQSLDQSRPTRQSGDLPRAPEAPRRQPDVGDEEDVAEEGKHADVQEDAEEEEEEEEDEMDAETRRRMELRERMAKMSGGMGMAGMFGPPGGMPMPGSKPPQRKKSTNKSTRSAESDLPSSPAATAPPIPMIPIPGMQTVRSPEPQVEKEQETEAPITGDREPQEMPDLEDIAAAPSRPSTDRAVPPVPQDRPFMASTGERAAPPPVPVERSVPPPPETRALPPRPPVATLERSDSEGSVSDDELSSRATAIPTPIAPPARPVDQRSPPVPLGRQPSYFGSEGTSPASPTPQSVSEKRASRAVPPVPGMAPPTSSIARAPPPPPPSTEPFAQAPPVPRVPVAANEESEYEGDYDTDIGSSVKHKDALKSHNRDISESTFTDEITPVSSPPVSMVTAPRAVPPPPPQLTTQIPTSRISLDAPRVAPPPPPPARNLDPEEDDEDDKRALPIRSVPPPPPNAPAPTPVAFDRQDSSDDLYSTSPPRMSMDRAPPPPPHAAPIQGDRSMPPTPSTQINAPSLPPSARQPVRQSMEVPRASMSAKRSMDQPRGNDGYIATDVDMGETTQWWTQRDLPPPIFQNRTDVLVEVEESQSSKRGGKTTISKDVYVIFMDYSQTVITARFDARDPTDVVFEQRHEPPPQRLRQDQLENFWQLYGARMADAAAAKKDSVVGDGSPRALVLELLAPFRDALLPVGTRAYGAPVYANIANASVQQFDEIRAGDIITLRNARFQGKHGTMHQKYAMDVGMIAPTGRSGTMTQEHVAVVADWDGTKKKIRAWEQGREKTKVRMESFRLGDLKSGEVRVWRVVGRQWVGWETGQ